MIRDRRKGGTSVRELARLRSCRNAHIHFDEKQPTMLRVLRVLLLTYLICGGIMYLRQQSILFPAASNDLYQFRSTLPKGSQLIEMRSSFGKVRAVYWPASKLISRAPAIIYMHGNFETVENSFDMIQPLVDAGIAVLQLEYPGFDGADGEPTYAALSESSVAAYDWLAGQSNIDSQRIVAMGYSIGGGVAGELTHLRSVRALILLSTFTSLEEMAHRHLLPGFLLQFPYDNLARVGEFAGPMFVAHGTDDNVIPFAMGKRLAAAAKHNNFIVLDCRHNDCDFGDALFTERIPEWLVRQGLLNRAPVATEGGSHESLGR